MKKGLWLITGGAGYIGSHIADQFIAAGYSVIILDSLLKGLESRVEYLRDKHRIEIPLLKLDIRDLESISTVMRDYKFDGIIQLAALKSVAESMQKPAEYFAVNLEAHEHLVNEAIKSKTNKIIFSSTAAVYGTPGGYEPCSEDSVPSPISPYGKSKLEAEKLVLNFNSIPGKNGTSLRFFNVIGTAAPELKDNSKDNLVPIILEKIAGRESPVIFGTDYPTRDGTCLRDYVDVRDVARAHLYVAASGKKLPEVINIGTGRNTSVREVIEMVLMKSNNLDLEIKENPKRLGDPAVLYANVDLARKELGFSTKYSLLESIESLMTDNSL